MKKAAITLLVVLIAVSCVTSRWLPTRSQDDRLDKLREMLKDLLESEIERSNYDRRNLFKREIGPSENQVVQPTTKFDNIQTSAAHSPLGKSHH